MIRMATVKQTRYRLYYDESGDHTYKLIEDPSRRNSALHMGWKCEQEGDPSLQSTALRR